VSKYGEPVATSGEGPAGPVQRGPVGVVLAGGAGRRIGGSKALVELNHRALISYPLEAVWRAVGNVTIVAKPDSELPGVPGAAVWIEPQEPRHPLTGIVHALSLADGRPVMVCAADMPLVTAELIERIACADPGETPAVVASCRGELQPLLGCYQPASLAPLSDAARDSRIRLRDAVAALGPTCYEVEDPDLVFNVNSPDELLQAAALIDRRRASRT
jgi:molybdopterin-guanine dinucleotide biosynthesis protein A